MSHILMEQPFRVQIISDLHLEVERGSDLIYCYDFTPAAPNLALLGDIGWTRDERLFVWLEDQLRRFERVFFVAGNHEPYVSTLAESMAILQRFASKHSNKTAGDLGEFVFLNSTRYDVSDHLSILGCTLWAALDPEDLEILSWSLTDFKRIHDFDHVAYDAAHRADISWLTNEIAKIRETEPARRVAVFTHHAPTIDDTGDPKYKGGPTSSAFATELTAGPCWGPPVALWAFGHTHWSCDFERLGVRVYSNQRGYGDGSRGFDASKVVEL